MPDDTVLVTGISELVTNDPARDDGPLGLIEKAALVCEGDRVAWVGPERAAPATDRRVDLGGRAVLPGFVDSHSHLVFAGDRATEFAARMNGRPYRASGILTTVEATRAATDEELRANLSRMVGEMRRQGTTTLECKSGYGLTADEELRQVRLASEVCDTTTLLAAHVVPPEYESKPDAYVDLVCGPMLDACAPYADYVDVFCERGAFDEDASRTVLEAAKRRGLPVRVHANQLGPGPGARLAAEYRAASADHCTFLDDTDITALADSGTVATLLPGVEFSTRSPYPDARRLIEAGATVALATDCNPGTCFTSSMPFCIALAVREMHMTPDEAVWSATAGGARALQRSDVGWLGPGSRADFVALDAPSHVYVAYRPAVPLIHQVWRGGSHEA